MRKEDLFAAMTDIDDRFIEEAAPKKMTAISAQAQETRKETGREDGKEEIASVKRHGLSHAQIMRFGSLAAACLVLIIGISIGMQSRISNSDKAKDDDIVTPLMSAQQAEGTADLAPEAAVGAAAENEADEAMEAPMEVAMEAPADVAMEAPEGAAAENAMDEAAVSDYAAMAENGAADEEALESVEEETEDETESETESESEDEIGTETPQSQSGIASIAESKPKK